MWYYSGRKKTQNENLEENHMPVRSRIPSRFILKELGKVMLTDWSSFASMAALQLDKETFQLRHPFGEKQGKAGKVRQVSLRITDMCNLRCHTCGQWGDNGYLLCKSSRELRDNEVPVETYKRMVDQIGEAGWSPLWYIWGGEPMLYRGLFDLLYYISERNMPIMMVTNGTQATKYVEEIVDTCKVVWLSVDGPNAEIHNRQRPGVSPNYDNFRDVENALQAIQEEKKRRNSVFPYIAPISVVARYNIDHLVDIYKFTRQYADLHIFYLSWWIDEQSAQQHTEEFQRRFGFAPHTHLGWLGEWKDFDHQQVYARFQEMERLMHEANTPPASRTNGGKNGHLPCIPLMYPPLRSSEDIQRYYQDHEAVFGYNQCVSIYMTMEIDSNGDVSLCRDYHDYVIGNIKEQSVQDIWTSEAARTFRRSISTEGLLPVCRRCCGLMGY
jgi:radical SAM protein with 4Fe4S-binding SPASM domain